MLIGVVFRGSEQGCLRHTRVALEQPWFGSPGMIEGVSGAQNPGLLYVLAGPRGSQFQFRPVDRLLSHPFSSARRSSSLRLPTVLRQRAALALTASRPPRLRGLSRRLPSRSSAQLRWRKRAPDRAAAAGSVIGQVLTSPRPARGERIPRQARTHSCTHPPASRRPDARTHAPNHWRAEGRTHSSTHPPTGEAKAINPKPPQTHLQTTFMQKTTPLPNQPWPVKFGVVPKDH